MVRLPPGRPVQIYIDAMIYDIGRHKSKGVSRSESCEHERTETFVLGYGINQGLRENVSIGGGRCMYISPTPTNLIPGDQSSNRAKEGSRSILP